MNPSRGQLLKPSQRENGTAKATRQIKSQSRFEILKHVVKTWCEDRFKVGAALLEIRDQKLYKEDYTTFEECCEAEFGIKRAHAYHLIEAADVKQSLKMSDMSDKITTPRQAVALSVVPQEEREKVIETVAAKGPVTAKAITETAKAITPSKPEKIIHRDKTGYAIPETILPEWNRAAAFDSTLREISKIKSIIEKATEDKDPIFGEVGNAAIAHLKNAYSDLTCVIPHAVCTSCQGRIPGKCTLCMGRGFISKFRYSLVPVETRRMREKKA